MGDEVTALASFENLTKRYGTGIAVDDLSFAVPEGEVCGLLGPNGAGKTTAIRALLGLARPTSGSTTLLGMNPGERGFTAAVRNVGTLIEGPALYGRATARQNMRIEADAIGLTDPEAEIRELLELVGLTERADTRCGSFSLGMKQRLGLGIALMGRPRLVVLDEPTNGLDPAGIVEIRELIKRLPERGTSVLVSSHLLAEIQLMCDRAVILQRGKLIAEGTIAQLLDGDGTGYVVRVDPKLTEQAMGTLGRVGLSADRDADDSIVVDGVIENGKEISQPLAQAGIYVHELQRQSVDLEQVFLRLTDESHDESPVEKPALAGVSDAV
ncbi:MAG: ABC transporter ATP-binding protein [Solirubrobacterales bacterium]|nr:ABC transporter ATP-binding protein [Solirubrobacterales bacterium]